MHKPILPTPSNAAIAHLHDVYQQITDIQLPLPSVYDREMVWWPFTREFTEADLRLVVKHLKKQYREPRYYMPCLRFKRLIGDLEEFRTILFEAQAVARNARPAQTNREQVLRSTGRTSETPKETARKTDEILASNAFKEFCKMKGKL